MVVTEATELEFDDNHAPLPSLEEQQVKVEVLAVDHQALLPFDEGEAAPSSRMKASSWRRMAASRSASSWPWRRLRKSRKYGPLKTYTGAPAMRTPGRGDLRALEGRAFDLLAEFPHAPASLRGALGLESAGLG